MLRIAEASTSAVGERPDEERRASLTQSRTLRNSIISLAVFFALVAGLLFAVPSLDAAADRIAHASLGWVLAGVRLGAALVPQLRGAVRPRVRPPWAQPQLAPFARGAGGQLGRVGQRAGGHRAGGVGAA